MHKNEWLLMALETLNGLWAHVISCQASWAWFMMWFFLNKKFSSCFRSLQKFSSTVWTWWCPSWTSTTLSAWWPTASAWCGSCPTGLWGTSGPQTSSGPPCQPSARRVTELPSASGNHHHPLLVNYLTTTAPNSHLPRDSPNLSL